MKHPLTENPRDFHTASQQTTILSMRARKVTCFRLSPTPHSNRRGVLQDNHKILSLAPERAQNHSVRINDNLGRIGFHIICGFDSAVIADHLCPGHTVLFQGASPAFFRVRAGYADYIETVGIAFMTLFHSRNTSDAPYAPRSPKSITVYFPISESDGKVPPSGLRSLNGGICRPCASSAAGRFWQPFSEVTSVASP